MIPKKSLFEIAKALGGLPVLGALPGTPAAEVGIRYGDVLLAVNGVRTPTVVEFLEARDRRDDGMDVVVFRDGVEQAWSLRWTPGGRAEPAAILGEVLAMRIAPTEGLGGGGSS